MIEGVPPRGTRTLVTGGTGVIGPVLVNQLIRAGCWVRVLARSAPDPGMFPPGVRFIAGDVTNRAVVGRAMEGVEVVYHLAAKLHINNPGHTLVSEYNRINVRGTHNVMLAAKAAGVRRVVFFSTTAVYGPTHFDDICDEESSAVATSLYGMTKRAAEIVVLDAGNNAAGVPLGVVLRLAGTYGPRIKGNYGWLVEWMRRGWFVPIGHSHNRRTLIYDEDAARAAILAAHHPAAAGKIFNVTDGAIHTFREILEAIAKALDRRPPTLHLPEKSVRAVAAVADFAMRVTGKSPKAGPLVDKMLEDMAVSGARIQNELGFRPLYDLERGWRETIPTLLKDKQY